MRIKIAIIVVAVLVVIAQSAYSTYTVVKQDYRLYQLESACARAQVMKGIERRDVVGCGKADYK